MQPYGPFRHLHESDFPKINADNRYAKIDQIADANFARYSKVVRAERISTVAEYHAALVERANNRAGQNIDHGSEPYLFNLEADSFDMHPFQSVYGVLTEKNVGDIGLDLGGKQPVYLAPDTLVVWR